MFQKSLVLFALNLVAFFTTTLYSQEAETDPTGKRLKPSEKFTVPTDAPVTRKKATFELYHETASNFKWKVEVIFDPRTYPYKILDGKISGTICDSPNWQITEGEIGPGLRIKAKNTNPTPNCSTDVVITGSAVHPNGYGGVYSFTPNGSAYGFQHSTLLLGFSDP